MGPASRASVIVRPSLEPDGGSDELWDSLAETYEFFVRRLVATLNDYGLLLSEYRALRLCRSAYVPLSTITKALGVTPAATTDIARRLVSRGLARRVANPSDRRSTLLAITPKGARLYREAHARYRSYLGRLNRSLSTEAREELAGRIAEMRRLVAGIEP
jgi:DNA-binding MarR family transcriptional regulator